MAEYYSEPAFFDAWTRGVQLAGTQFFTVRKPIKTKHDLEPDFDMIESGMGYLSSGERLFLTAMYSFYNSHGAAILYGRPFTPGDIAAALDEPRLRIVADLTVSYTGW